MAPTTFDAAYYGRFYEDPKSRVADLAHYAALGAFVAGYAGLLGIQVRSVVDLGCGLGRWKPVVRRRFPGARYVGVEVSDYLCGKHGWVRGSAVDYSGPAVDLVICQGVLQYLPARAAARALVNIRRLTRGLLYLEALTQEDWDTHCDQDRTDGDVFLRSADWYRKRLKRGFCPLGGGVFLPKDSDVVLYELERPT